MPPAHPTDHQQHMTRVHSSSATIAGELVYCVGDVHGCYGLLKLLLSKIVRDCGSRAGSRKPILIFCGDYVDKGPDSAKVLETVGWLKRHAMVETHFLMGNHERAMLDYIEDPVGEYKWLEFGGFNTLNSYGVEGPSVTASAWEHVQARDNLLNRMPASHVATLKNLELIVGIGDYAFVHAGVKPKRRLEKQRPDDLLWIRDEFLEWTGSYSKIIVHGHTWKDDQVQIATQRIGVDTGAYKTNVLSAIRIEDREIEIIQARN